MVTVPVRHSSRGVYLHKKLAQSIDLQLDKIEHNEQDALIFIDGPEGSGKSFAARQIGYYVAHELGTSFGLDNVHNDLQSYINFSLDAPQRSVVVMDEGRKVLNRKRSMGKEAVRFTNYLSECREDIHQFHIVCAPSFQDVDSYVAKWRMKFLIHMFLTWEKATDKYRTGEKPVLGNYMVYDNNQKLKQHYDWGNYSYPKKWWAKGKFNGTEVFTKDEIRKYKRQKKGKMREKYGGGRALTSKDKAVHAVIKYVKDNKLMSDAYKSYKDSLDFSKRTFTRNLGKVLDE